MRLLLLLVALPALHAQTFIDEELPSGPVDGINRVFVLAHIPNPLSSVSIYVNGIRTRKCTTCTVDVSTTAGRTVITFSSLNIPPPGTVLLVSYRYNFPHSPVWDERPTGLIDGINTIFTLTLSPSPAASLLLIRNGLLQESGIDYVLNGRTITFSNTPSSIPQPGDSIIAKVYYH